jgi:hypothetical protein
VGASCNRTITRIREKVPQRFVQMRTISIGHIQGGIADEARPSGRRFYYPFRMSDVAFLTRFRFHRMSAFPKMRHSRRSVPAIQQGDAACGIFPPKKTPVIE